MKILVVQETDWLLRGPHQQHHLMERMIQRGHEVQVVDYNLLWKDEKSKGRLVSKGFVIETPGKVIEKSKIKLIRPKIIKLPIWDKLSIPLIYPKE
ncbi:MAG: glycosyltransferase WbuB, partial [Candidatus Thermoplasmatota archaeon]|nr:glycosyltransferase WbuB [Candidatus Thermoplasmatota archaeon]